MAVQKPRLSLFEIATYILAIFRVCLLRLIRLVVIMD